MSRTRRRFVSHSAGLLAALASASSWAAPPRASVDQRRLANRLELWATFSQRSRTLVARYHSTRTSSLLEAPLEVDGQLFFVAPDLLVLRDEGFSGSITRIEGTRISVRSTQAGAGDQAAARSIESSSGDFPGLSWTADRLVRIFSPGPGDRLIDEARHEVPRSRSPRLILRPPREHLARLELRDLTMQLDPVGGAPLRIEIAQAQGDRHRLDLADHRQDQSPEEVRALIERA